LYEYHKAFFFIAIVGKFMKKINIDVSWTLKTLDHKDENTFWKKMTWKKNTIITTFHNFKLAIVCFMCVNMGKNVMHTLDVSIYNCYVLTIYICSFYMLISRFMKDKWL
jgi:hypothetical protein